MPWLQVLVAVVPCRGPEGMLIGLRSSIGLVPYDPDDPDEIPFTIPAGVGATASPVEISIRPPR